MKKIIVIFPAVLLSLFLQAQNSRIEGAKKLTVEEANQLNGVAQPTINGKPYSQYKAEQEAMKNQSLAKKPAGYVSPISATKAEPVKTSAGDGQPDNKQLPKVEAAVVKNAVEPNKDAAGLSLPFANRGGVTSPAPEVAQASQKGTSQDPDAKPVQAAPVQKGKEGGSVTPVESAVVKAPARDAVVPQGKAPVPPTAVEEKSSEAGNSTNGEKPAQVPPAKQQ